MKKKRSEAPAASPDTASANRGKARLLLLLLGGAFLLTVLYFYLVTLSETVMKITVLFFLLSCAVLALAYVVVNRGHLGGDLTPGMLSDALTPAEKTAYIRETRERKRNSRWILMLLFMFLIPLAVDLLKLFVIDRIFPDLF